MRAAGRSNLISLAKRFPKYAEIEGLPRLQRFRPQWSLTWSVCTSNDTAVIRRNPKVTAINSTIEVDLTGQVCADSIGTSLYSGVGGQMDFIRGASLSVGGKPIIALPSVTSKGESRIVPILKPGAGVVTTRAHVHYVVTENGVANLYGRNLPAGEGFDQPCPPSPPRDSRARSFRAFPDVV